MCSKDFKFLQISVFSVIKLGKYQIKIGICFLFPQNPIYPTPTCMGYFKQRINFWQP